MKVTIKTLRIVVGISILIPIYVLFLTAKNQTFGDPSIVKPLSHVMSTALVILIFSFFTSFLTKSRFALKLSSVLAIIGGIITFPAGILAFLSGVTTFKDPIKGRFIPRRRVILAALLLIFIFGSRLATEPTKKTVILNRSGNAIYESIGSFATEEGLSKKQVKYAVRVIDKYVVNNNIDNSVRPKDLVEPLKVELNKSKIYQYSTDDVKIILAGFIQYSNSLAEEQK